MGIARSLKDSDKKYEQQKSRVCSTNRQLIFYATRLQLCRCPEFRSARVEPTGQLFAPNLIGLVPTMRLPVESPEGVRHPSIPPRHLRRSVGR
jgi:hypothetical protein